MFKGLALPPIAPHDATVYAVLRSAHTWLALLLFATVLVHLAAALFHAWVRRDAVFAGMAKGPRSDEVAADLVTREINHLLSTRD